MTSPISSLGYSPYASSATGYVDPTAMPTSGTTENDPSQPMLDPQAFLKLLVAQLQYQDPSSPADMSSFMSQTATLSQTQSMNSMQQTLNTLLATEQAQTATSLIGKTVTYTDASGNVGSGLVTGAASLASGAQVLIGNQSVAVANVTGVTAS
jgi:flagellar basal-body rod modification protein FlgD